MSFSSDDEDPPHSTEMTDSQSQIQVGGERAGLLSDQHSQLLAQKKIDLQSAIKGGALLPSKKQAIASVVALFVAGYLTYRTGPSFFFFSYEGRDAVLGILFIIHILILVYQKK